MKILVLIVALYVAYEAARVGYLAYVSSGLVAEAQRFERSGGAREILVIGDSTAVGVGAASAEVSVAGRLAGAHDFSVENHAVSGAVVADLAAQLALASRDRYDLILIQAGANDVIQLHHLDAANTEMRSVLKDVHKRSDRVVLLTAGKIGEAPIFPWFIRSLMTGRAKELRDMLSATAREEGVAYVDLYNIPDPFASDPRRYYAPDGLHLTGDGYGFWEDEVVKTIEGAWPGFLHG